MGCHRSKLLENVDPVLKAWPRAVKIGRDL